MVLEGCESRDDFAFEPECRHAVRDALLGIRDDSTDGLTQLLQRRPLRLVERGYLFVDPLRWHPVIVECGRDVIKAGT